MAQKSAQESKLVLKQGFDFSFSRKHQLGGAALAGERPGKDIGKGAASIVMSPRIRGLPQRRCNENLSGGCIILSQN